MVFPICFQLSVSLSFFSLLISEQWGQTLCQASGLRFFISFHFPHFLPLSSQIILISHFLYHSHSFAEKPSHYLKNIHFRALLDEQNHRWILWNLDRIKNWGWHRVACYTEIFIIRLVSNKYDELSFIQPAQTKYDKKTTSVRFLTHCKTLHNSHKALLEYKYSSSHFHSMFWFK